ncbi:MAG: hypothetical protein J6A59_14035 [Lachnospiraceae bacterium]|nr:hypothetical protein [Lachnospiraceae bacterium]
MDMNPEIVEFIECYIATMTEEELQHIKDCCIKLDGNDNIINTLYNHSLIDFIKVNVLNYSELKMIKVIVTEVKYLKDR